MRAGELGAPLLGLSGSELLSRVAPGLRVRIHALCVGVALGELVVGDDRLRGFKQIRGTFVWCAQRRQSPCRLVAHVEQDGAASGALAGLDVVKQVSHHP